MRGSPSPSASSAASSSEDEDEGTSTEERDAELSAESSSGATGAVGRLSGAIVPRDWPSVLASESGVSRVMRTVMVVEFKVVEVTRISIRTRRTAGQSRSGQDCTTTTTDDESEALDEADAIDNKLARAIQSLDSLNDQIVRFIFSPAASLASISGVGGHSEVGPNRPEAALVPVEASLEGATLPSGDDRPRQPIATSPHSDVVESKRTPQPSSLHDFERDALLPAANSTSFLPSNEAEQRQSLSSSMALMRRLLVDAQAKFRRMMEENKALASRIDGDIQTAHQEVSLLRAELADTNKRITQITNSVSVTDASSPSSPLGVREASSAAMKVVELSSEPASGFERENGKGSGGCRSPDRTKATNVVEPLVKKPPSKATGLRRQSGLMAAAVGKRNRPGDKLVTRNGESRRGSMARDDDPVVGCVDLMTGKSQDADDEDGDCDRCRACPHRDPANVFPLEEKLNNLEEQNEQLNERIGSLQKELDVMHRVSRTEQANGEKDNYPAELETAPGGGGTSSERTSSVDLPAAVASSSSSSSVTLKHPEVERLETELKHAKDALAALKADRKRLKAEKFDLLNQMKQLYGTLEDKEKELRDFIRNYEQRMRESDDNLKQLVREREDSEREKWNILKHARDEAERSVALCAQLGIKEAQVKQLQEELVRIREKLGYISDTDMRSGGSCRSNGYRSPSAASTRTHNGRESSDTPTPTLGGSEPTSSYDGTPTITVDRDSGCSPGHGHRHHRDKDALRPSLTGLSRSAEEIYNSSGSSDTGAAGLSKKSARRKGRDNKNVDGRSTSSGTWGSISRVFSRSRQRKSLDPGFYEASGSEQQRSSWSPQSSLCASPLTEDSYAEKLKLLEEARGQRMDRWKAATVLAWLEITLGMPQYGPMCAENIKSGKILLELSDPELEAGLGIANSMHRRKLRLAIEEHRDPPSNPYPKISHLSHAWVIEEWLPSLGLLIYADNFARQLVDGRVLETLSKKDLEKSLGVTRKFHQVSLTHAVQLLRMVKFDKQLLQQRRSHSESMDVDPLVWTNQRFVKWAKSIDLSEYADNLRDSGVHGALVVLEPSFQADTMATALGIPASKNIIRRHLTTELDNLVQPARMSLEAEALVNSKRGKSTSSLHSSSSGSLGRNFLRSSSSKGLSPDRPDNKRRSSMRGSLTRALGLKLEEELSSHHHHLRINDSSTELEQQRQLQQRRHNSTPELTKKTMTTGDGMTSIASSNWRPQRRSVSASRVITPSSSSSSSSKQRVATGGKYLETMTVTPV